jgi:hypothetical protein
MHPIEPPHKAQTAITSLLILVLFLVYVSKAGFLHLPPGHAAAPDSGWGSSAAPERVPRSMRAGLLQAIGRGQGPVVVGGVGDSGTRGIRDILRLFGVQMLGKQYVNNGPGDSKIFEMNYDVFDSAGALHVRNVRHLYVDALRRAHTLNYNATHVASEDWQMGVELVAHMTWLSMNTSAAMRQERKPLGVWGYKHPRTTLILPYLRAALGARFKFIHVLRDPKEVVEGHNQMLYVDMCHRYYGKVCGSGLESRLEFWADLNLDLFNLARTQLEPHQYLAVRTEDFVASKLACYQRLARFVNADASKAQSGMPSAMNHSARHIDSYFGKQTLPESKKSIFAAVARARPQVRRALALYGYAEAAFKFTKECGELPEA